MATTATLPSNNFAIRNFQPHIGYPPSGVSGTQSRSNAIPSTGSQNHNSPGSTDNDSSDNRSNSHTTAEAELSPTRPEGFGNHFSNNQNFPPGQQGNNNFNNSEFFSPFGSNSNFLSYPMGLSSVPQMNFGFDNNKSESMTMREPKPYKCPQCVKTFANNSYLSQHMRIHLGMKPFGPCQYCGKRFTQLSHLQQHIRTHTGEKPYRCKIGGCDKAFSQLSNLQSHSRCHQSDKPFKCNSCYKCFNDEATLLEHIPKHKDSKHLKVHICHYCGKSYTQALYLDKHMTKHTDKRHEFKIPKQYYGNELSADNFDTLNQLNQFNQLSGFARFQMDAVANVSAAAASNGVNHAAAYAYPTVTNPNALIGNAATLSSQLNLFQQQINRQNNFRSNGSTPNGNNNNNNERNGSIPGFNMITPLEKINSFNQTNTNGTTATTNGTNSGGNYS